MAGTQKNEMDCISSYAYFADKGVCYYFACRMDNRNGKSALIGALFL
jgi:hypothetical protein